MVADSAPVIANLPSAEMLSKACMPRVIQRQTCLHMNVTALAFAYSSGCMHAS